MRLVNSPWDYPSSEVCGFGLAHMVNPHLANKVEQTKPGAEGGDWRIEGISSESMVRKSRRNIKQVEINRSYGALCAGECARIKLLLQQQLG